MSIILEHSHGHRKFPAAGMNSSVMIWLGSLCARNMRTEDCRMNRTLIQNARPLRPTFSVPIIRILCNMGFQVWVSIPSFPSHRTVSPSLQCHPRTYIKVHERIKTVRNICHTDLISSADIWSKPHGGPVAASKHGKSHPIKES